MVKPLTVDVVKMFLSDEVKGIWRDNEGCLIEESRRSEWAHQVAKNLAENKEEWASYLLSGDSIVVAFSDDNSIEVYDCLIRRKLRF